MLVKETSLLRVNDTLREGVSVCVLWLVILSETEAEMSDDSERVSESEMLSDVESVCDPDLDFSLDRVREGEAVAETSALAVSETEVEVVTLRDCSFVGVSVAEGSFVGVWLGVSVLVGAFEGVDEAVSALEGVDVNDKDWVSVTDGVFVIEISYETVNVSVFVRDALR